MPWNEAACVRRADVIFVTWEKLREKTALLCLAACSMGCVPSHSLHGDGSPEAAERVRALLALTYHSDLAVQHACAGGGAFQETPIVL